MSGSMTMLPRYHGGFDDGNSDVSLVLSGPPERHVTIPSAVSLGTLAKMTRVVSGRDGVDYLRQGDALQGGEYVVKYDQTEYYVGSLALKEAREEKTGRGDITRYWSRKALVRLLATVGALIPQDCELFLVTGLPVNSFTRENAGRVKEALNGSHAFQWNGRDRFVRVHVMRVVMEAAGALITYGAEGKRTRQGVIDIGGRTTDIYAAEGQHPLVDWCRGIPIGVESVGDLLSAKYQEAYGRALTPAEIRACLMGYFTGFTMPIRTHGRSVSGADLSRWMAEAISTVAQEIVGFISASWRSSEEGGIAEDLDPVLLIGGGAYSFYKDLHAHIPHILTPDRPELANAEGYAALAQVTYERTVRSSQESAS